MDLIINEFYIEITENYEGDRFHVVVYEIGDLPYDWYNTFHCNNEITLITLLFNLHNK